MTAAGTSHDHLSIAELNDRIISGEIALFDLPDDLILEWGMWQPDPVPLTSFTLSDPDQREAFLY